MICSLYHSISQKVSQCLHQISQKIHKKKHGKTKKHQNVQITHEISSALNLRPLCVSWIGPVGNRPDHGTRGCGPVPPGLGEKVLGDRSRGGRSTGFPWQTRGRFPPMTQWIHMIHFPAMEVSKKWKVHAKIIPFFSDGLS